MFIVIDPRDLSAPLAETLLAELRLLLRNNDAPAAPSSARPVPPSTGQRGHVLSDAEAEAFLERLSPTTLNVVKAVLKLGPRFTGSQLEDVLRTEFGVDKFGTGAASGLTRAIRNVTGNRRAEFMHWSRDEYWVAEETIAALRRVLQY
jgi:hypothetical protein